jgi:hypothetical protein
MIFAPSVTFPDTTPIDLQASIPKSNSVGFSALRRSTAIRIGI